MRRCACSRAKRSDIRLRQTLPGRASDAAPTPVSSSALAVPGYARSLSAETYSRPLATKASVATLCIVYLRSVDLCLQIELKVYVTSVFEKTGKIAVLFFMHRVRILHPQLGKPQPTTPQHQARMIILTIGLFVLRLLLERARERKRNCSPAAPKPFYFRLSHQMQVITELS